MPLLSENKKTSRLGEFSPERKLRLLDQAIAEKSGEDFSRRVDGTKKGKGFLGELKAVGGKVSTEISIGVNIDGKETEIPTLIPTLNETEKQHLLSGKKPTDEIVQKATSHARKRINEGRSPFADDEKSTFGSKRRLELLDQIIAEKEAKVPAEVDEPTWGETLIKAPASGLAGVNVGLARLAKDVIKIADLPTNIARRVMGMKGERPDIEFLESYIESEKGRQAKLDISEKLRKLPHWDPKRILGTGLQAIPQVAAVAGGALMGAPFIGGTTAAATMLGAIAYGPSAEEAKAEGATEIQQILHGITSAQIEVLTELPVFRAVGQIWKHLRGVGIAKKVGVNFAKRLLTGLGLYGKGLALETTQEVEAYLGGQISKRLHYDPNATINFKDAVEAGYGGLAMAATIGIAGVPAMGVRAAAKTPEARQAVIEAEMPTPMTTISEETTNLASVKPLPIPMRAFGMREKPIEPIPTEPTAEVAREPVGVEKPFRKQAWEMTLEEYSAYNKEIHPLFVKGTLENRRKKTIQQALKKGKPVPKNVLAEYPDLKPPREVAAEKVEKAEVPEITKPELEEKYGRFLEKVGKRLESEAIGQDILDTLEEQKTSPANVSKTFWEDTFFKLPSDAQDNITKYLKSLTGMKPGDVIATLKGKEIKAKDWFDIAKMLGDDFTSIEHLEGTERGYIALMAYANEQIKITPAKPPSPKPPKAKPPEAVTEEIKGEAIPKPTPKELKLTRILEKGEVPSTEKPHGLYFTVGEVSPHREIGTEEIKAIAKGKNVLKVPSIKVTHVRFGELKSGEASSGISALKNLVDEKDFDRLLKLNKKDLITELSEKYPKTKWDKYYDSYEILEGYAGLLAREKGYDAILQIDKTAPEFSEYVALTDKAFEKIPEAKPKVEKEKVEVTSEKTVGSAKELWKISYSEVEKINKQKKGIFRTAILDTIKVMDESDDLGIRVHTDPIELVSAEIAKEFGLKKPKLLKIGDKLADRSYTWAEDTPTNDELQGVSVLSINEDGSNINEMIDDLRAYKGAGKQVIIVTGDKVGYGEDTNEGIMANAKVRYVLPIDILDRPSKIIHRMRVQDALKSGKLTPEKYTELHEKDYPDLKVEKKVEVETTPEGKEISVDLTKKEEAAVTPKKQKEYLMAEIDTAVEEASDIELEHLELPVFPWRADEAGIAIYEKEKRKVLDEMKKRQDEYGTITIHVPDDGIFTILNTKQALQDFKKKAKKFPSVLSKPKVTVPGVIRKTPLKEDIGEIKTKVGAEYFTDGHLIIKGKAPARAKYSKGDYPQKNVKEFLETETEPAKLKYYAFQNPDVGEGVAGTPIPVILTSDAYHGFAVFQAKDGELFNYDQLKFNAIVKRFPKAKYGISKEEWKEGLLIAYENKKPVAALMPMKIVDIEGGVMEGMAAKQGFIKGKLEKPTGVKEPALMQEEHPEEYVPITRKEADSLFDKGAAILVARFNIRGAETTGEEGYYMRLPVQKEIGYGTKQLRYDEEIVSLYEKYKKRYGKGKTISIAEREADQYHRRFFPVLRDKKKLAETKFRLIENSKSEKGDSELINDLSQLGADTIRRGHESFKAFSAQMKTTLSEVWDKIKHLMREAYEAAKTVLKSERGEVVLRPKKLTAAEKMLGIRKPKEKDIIKIYKEKHIALKPKRLRLTKETAKDFIAKVYRKFVFKEYPAIRLAEKSKDPKVIQRVQDQINRVWGKGGIVEVFVAGKGPHRYDKEGKPVYIEGTQSLKEIVKDLNPQEYEDYETLRVAERDVALAKFRPDIKATDLKSSTQVIEAIEKKYGERIKKLRDISEAQRKYDDILLQLLVEEGWLSKKNYKAIKEKPEAEFYASFMREMEFVGEQVLGGKDPLKRIKGSELRKIPTIESSISNTYKTIKLLETIKLNKEIVNLKDLTPDLAEVIKKVKPRYAIRDVPKIEKKIFIPLPTPPKNAIIVPVDGAKQYWEIPSDVYKAIDYYSPQEISMVIKILSGPARLLRAGATLSAEFIMRNPVRDQFTAMVYSKYGYIPFWDFGKGFFELMKKGDLYQEFKAGGGEQSYFTSMDRTTLNMTTKDIVGFRKGLKTYNPIEYLRIASEAMEKATRLGIFKRAKAKGATVPQATAAARESTLDFRRIGEERRINQIIAFWNANVQGIDIMRRKLHKHPGRTLLRLTMGITLPSIALWLYNNSDDERKKRYNALPGWRKNFFWNIIIEDMPIISLPKPFELGLIFGSLPERILDYIALNDPKELKTIAQSIKDGAMPGLIPTAALPILENMTNWSFFMERPIESETIKRLPPGQRAHQYTSSVLRKFGKATNLSPIKMENWVRGWTGGLGKFGLDIIDPLFETDEIPEVTKHWYEVTPGLKGFVAKEFVGGKDITNFYDNLEKITQAEQGYKLLFKTDTKEAEKFNEKTKGIKSFAFSFRKTSRKLGKLRKRKSVIMESKEYTSDKKRELVDEIDERMTEIARARNETLLKPIGKQAIPGMVPWKTKKKKPAWQKSVGFGKKPSWQTSVF